MSPFSQREEEQVILEFFGDSTGRYLDLGAYNGSTFSNTRALAERGWEGVAVEPAAPAFAAMLNGPPPHARLVNVLVGPHTGLASFLVSRDAVSTTDRAHARKWGAETFTPIFVGSITIFDLLKDFPGPYRCLSVDTEGTSSYLVRTIAPMVDELELQLICYEHDNNYVHIDGFKQVYESEENCILVRL
jgi:FkbM family methyltransferase